MTYTFAGVGKTSLVHLICQSTPIDNPYWTIGCSVDVKVSTLLTFYHRLSVDLAVGGTPSKIKIAPKLFIHFWNDTHHIKLNYFLYDTIGERLYPNSNC